MTVPVHLWLEPGQDDADLGLQARVADPVWFLTRQWQLGELQGEDSSSPVSVELAPQHVPLAYFTPRADLDPTVVPAEALLETEPGDWWTIGRRVRLGRAVAPLLAPGSADAFRFGSLPSPYEPLAGEVDGRAVFAAGVLPGHAVWAEVPQVGPDAWSERELEYSGRFDVAGHTLTASGHTGGEVDWFSVDAERGAGVAAATPSRLVVPGRLTYPGAPHPRWWQLEDRAVDIGGFAPDRSHLATMLLLDVVLAHPDDWFTFPVPPPAQPEVNPSSGVLVRLGEVRVHDSFDQVWDLKAPPADGPDAWSLFHTAGLAESDLVVWPVAVAPSAGPVLDDVLLGVDEDANLAWALELRADGRQLLADADTSTAAAETTRTGTRSFRYAPSTTLPDRWHPYQRIHAGDPDGVSGAGDGRSGTWRQGVLADLTGPEPKPRPGPVSKLIGGPSGSTLGRGHELAARAIPSSGVRLQRRARLARDAYGRPVLWVERSALPLTGPPTSHLRFDVMAEEPPPS